MTDQDSEFMPATVTYATYAEDGVSYQEEPVDEHKVLLWTSQGINFAFGNNGGDSQSVIYSRVAPDLWENHLTLYVANNTGKECLLKGGNEPVSMAESKGPSCIYLAQLELSLGDDCYIALHKNSKDKWNLKVFGQGSKLHYALCPKKDLTLPPLTSLYEIELTLTTKKLPQAGRKSFEIQLRRVEGLQPSQQWLEFELAHPPGKPSLNPPPLAIVFHPNRAHVSRDDNQIDFILINTSNNPLAQKLPAKAAPFRLEFRTNKNKDASALTTDKDAHNIVIDPKDPTNWKVVKSLGSKPYWDLIPLAEQVLAARGEARFTCSAIRPGTQPKGWALAYLRAENLPEYKDSSFATAIEKEDKPVITSLELDPPKLDYNYTGKVALRWKAFGGLCDVFIAGKRLGSQLDPAKQNAIEFSVERAQQPIRCELECAPEGAEQRSHRGLTLEINPPQILRLGPEKPVRFLEPVELQWEVTSAEECTLFEEGKEIPNMPLKGSRRVHPYKMPATAYKLVCKGTKTVERRLEINIISFCKIYYSHNGGIWCWDGSSPDKGGELILKEHPQNPIRDLTYFDNHLYWIADKFPGIFCCDIRKPFVSPNLRHFGHKQQWHFCTFVPGIPWAIGFQKNDAFLYSLMPPSNQEWEQGTKPTETESKFWDYKLRLAPGTQCAQGPCLVLLERGKDGGQDVLRVIEPRGPLKDFLEIYRSSFIEDICVAGGWLFFIADWDTLYSKRLSDSSKPGINCKINRLGVLRRSLGAIQVADQVQPLWLELDRDNRRTLWMSFNGEARIAGELGFAPEPSSHRTGFEHGMVIVSSNGESLPQ
jgi:hypothetical protein